MKTTRQPSVAKATPSKCTRRAKPAMDAFEARLPDLVVIDINLKDEIEGGFDLCREPAKPVARTCLSSS